jgi:Histidine kinase-, DNA gyrase B-, and HSP90-like ATPase
MRGKVGVAVVRTEVAEELWSSGPSIVSPGNFLMAMRDTGYKATSLAIAEFIDNSIQASARWVSVDILPSADSRYPIEVSVSDDGTGMDAMTLAHALAFGGSSRFNDRSSLGRFGMGLPNGGLSCSRRIEVYSWRDQEVLHSCLDIDGIIAGRDREFPTVRHVERSVFVPTTPTGTVIRLARCDRLEYKRPSALARRLAEDLGRIYRRFVDTGLDLHVNGQSVVAVDPLCLQEGAKTTGGRQFGDVLVYKVPGAAGPGKVRVRFSELPVDRWHALSGAEKRELGVTNAPCVSVLRAGREIDRGWFFMGGKRRENYDDWWRCEVDFDPVLDELFGVTHAKQAICPREELLALLVPDLEPIARALNTRVRRRFELAKATEPLSAAERQAGRADASLPALPRHRDGIPPDLAVLVDADGSPVGSQQVPYRIIAAELPGTSAFEVAVRGRQLVLLLNSRHPLYRDLYGPLAMSDSAKDQDTAKQVALAVLAAARAEASTWRGGSRVQAQHFRQTWADVLSTFLNA